MTMANTFSIALYKGDFSISTSTTIYLADSRPTRLWEPNQCETIIYTDLSRSSWVSTFWLHQCQNIHSWNGKSTSEEEMPFTSGYVHNIQFWMPCFTPIMTSSHLFAFLSLGLLLLNQIILLPDSRYYTTAAALFLLTLSDKNYATLFHYRMFTHLLEL